MFCHPDTNFPPSTLLIKFKFQYTKNEPKTICSLFGCEYEKVISIIITQSSSIRGKYDI